MILYIFCILMLSWLSAYNQVGLKDNMYCYRLMFMLYSVNVGYHQPDGLREHKSQCSPNLFNR